jgi:hypothetical protein
MDCPLDELLSRRPSLRSYRPNEVYKATDINLKRAVAIKVQREAEVLASLNHPKSARSTPCAHGRFSRLRQAVLAIVMELVEGPTLADRLAQGALPVDEALLPAPDDGRCSVSTGCGRFFYPNRCVWTSAWRHATSQ